MAIIHNIEGDYGKVRTFFHTPSPLAKSIFDYSTSAGWHRCNDKYVVTRENGVEDYILFITVSGRGRLTLHNCAFTMTNEHIVIIPKNAPHEYGVPPGETWEFYWMHVGGASADAMLAHIVDSYGCFLAAEPIAGNICRNIEDLVLVNNIQRPSCEAQASLLISNILHCLLIHLQDAEMDALDQKDAVRALLKTIETNFNAKLSIKDISSSLYMSSAHLGRLVKKRTGYTPYEYLLHYRIMKSKELLLYTDYGMKEIAKKTGFCSASNYIHQFKATESVTPEKFRFQNRSNGIPLVI